MRAWNHPNFGGLVDLSQREGVDIRPTLLRVITDTYLQNLTHAPDDDRQYIELAQRLLKETDIATRAAISARLAHERGIPRVIILQLARDVHEVADPILKYSPVLTQQDRDTIAREQGQTRADLFAEHKQAATLALSGSSASSSDPAGHDIASGPRAKPASDAEELSELFFAASSTERRLILIHLDHAAIEPSAPSEPLRRSDVWRLETAALRHETEVVGQELNRALGVSHALARRIVDDELGEPIAVVGKAMLLPADVLQRMILFLNPSVGHSIDRVYQLSSLYGEISVEAAQRMVTIWRCADPTAMRAARHETLPWRHAAENTRRALSQISRTPMHQTLRHDVVSR